jgi:hypothetical protein
VVIMDESRVDELYAAPLDRFIADRTALAKDLKAAGDRDGAAHVQSLRKPSVSAWAVNQLVRDRRVEVEELLGLGEDLHSAQRKALTGGGAKELQQLASRRRELVERLTDRAGRILRAAGASGSRTHLDEVANTLLATATDPQAAADVRRGRLERDLPPPAGFGDFAQLADVIPLPTRAKAAPKDAKAKAGRTAASEWAAPVEAKPRVQSAADTRARKRLAELEKEAEEAAATAGQLRTEADIAETEARRLAEEAERAERAAARARREADRSEQRAAGAKERAAKAAARLRGQPSPKPSARR